jgi:hypothetical protein
MQGLGETKRLGRLEIDDELDRKLTSVLTTIKQYLSQGLFIRSGFRTHHASY